MDNIIQDLEQLTGLTTEQLCKEFSNRSNTTAIDATKLKNWGNGNELMPAWVERITTQWMIELWQDERAKCNASELWQVDTKYTHMLGFLTMSEIASMVQKHKTNNNTSKDNTANDANLPGS